MQAIVNRLPIIRTNLKSLFIFLCKFLIALSVLVLFQHLCLYLALGTSTIMFWNQFLTNTLYFSNNTALSLSLALNGALGASALFLLKETSIFRKSVNGLKFLTVNILPINLFLRMTDLLPIGSWLEFDTQRSFGNNPIHRAVKYNDEALLDKILARASKQALYKYLKELDWLGNNPLYYATELFRGKVHFLRKIIKAIEPEHLCSLLKSLSYRLGPYMFSLVACFDSEEEIDFVLQATPEKDRWELINQRNNDCSSLTIYQALRRRGLKEVSTLLKYVPADKLMEYLNATDKSGKTALMYFAQYTNPTVLKFVLDLIPKDKLSAFFAFKDQGKRALMYANTVEKNRKTFDVLSRVGLALTEEESKVTRKALIDLEHQHEAEEGFKEKHQEYPQSILGIDMDSDLTDVKTAYRQQMLRFHPDKQTGEKKDNDMAIRLVTAYEFFTKEDVQSSYRNTKKWSL